MGFFERRSSPHSTPVGGGNAPFCCLPTANKSKKKKTKFSLERQEDSISHNASHTTTGRERREEGGEEFALHPWSFPPQRSDAEAAADMVKDQEVERIARKLDKMVQKKSMVSESSRQVMMSEEGNTLKSWHSPDLKLTHLESAQS